MGVFKKGEKWYIDYYVRGRRKREKIGPSRAQARVVLQKRKVQIAESRFLDIEKEHRIPFDKMATDYLDTYSKPHKRSSWRDEISIRHLSHHFGNKPLQEITPHDVEKYQQKRVKEVSRSTVNREMRA